MTGSPPDLLVLHAVRLLGFAEPDAVAARAGVPETEAAELILDAQARGWVQHSTFGGLGGWYLTDAGKAENERQLATERRAADPDDMIPLLYQDFLPLNTRLVTACTDWQLRPTRQARVLNELGILGSALEPLVDRLAGVHTRFDGYHTRYAAALTRARAGGHEWVDRTDRDSCHKVWFQLHEDLIATLGITRQTG